MKINAPFTEENFQKYGHDYDVGLFFDEAGLGGLPDPDDQYNLKSLKEWLIACVMDRAQCTPEQAEETFRTMFHK